MFAMHNKLSTVRGNDSTECKGNPTAGNGFSTAGTRSPLRLAAALAVIIAAAQVATAQPNLVVRFDGEVLSNHEELVFPDTQVGESTRIVVVLRNEGNETLTFTETPPVMMAGGFPEQFAIVQPALENGNTLSPNGSTAFAIDFEPQFRFERLFTHVYLWTNASASPFHIIFSGKATGSELAVLVDGVEIPDGGVATFPETEVGDSVTVTVTIENLGDAPLTLTGDPRAQIFGGFDFDFAVDTQPEATIPGGGSSSFEVTFAPTLERLYTTRLFIETDATEGTNNGLYDIDIEANAFAVPVEEEPIDEPGDDEPIEDEPVEDEPADEDPADDQPADDDTNQDQPVDESPDAGDMDDDQGGLNEDEQPIDERPADDDAEGELTDEEMQELLEDNPLVPATGLCGFGAGFAGLMGLISLGGAKTVRRRRSTVTRLA